MKHDFSIIFLFFGGSKFLSSHEPKTDSTPHLYCPPPTRLKCNSRREVGLSSLFNKKKFKKMAQLLIVVYGKTNMFSCFMIVIGPIIYMLIEMQNICNLSDCCFDCWHNPLQSVVVNRDMPW